MGLNDTPSGERIHIGFFGRRNAGKSSLVNAVTQQSIAIVSDVKGTTTDPVFKSMELLPLGPVMIIDTPGFDDEGDLGELRVQKTRQVLRKTDVAVLVVDSSEGLKQCDKEIIGMFKKTHIPFIVAFNKSDIESCDVADVNSDIRFVSVSALTGMGIEKLKDEIGKIEQRTNQKGIVEGLIEKGQVAVLVTPIDSSAPKGRLILPQQQTIRAVIDSGAIAVVTQVPELKHTLQMLSDLPEVVITDSQAFKEVSEIVPDSIPLTSFSILMANHKGTLKSSVEGVAAINTLKNGDTVLISEGCTHHRQCEDIGTVKLPKWIGNYTGKDLKFEFSSGTEFPEELSRFSLIIHCGGCMVNEREMKYRIKCAAEYGVPMTNYGMTIAYVHGILRRSLSVFPEIAKKLD